MDTEQDRLQRLYGEMSVEHLLDLAEDREDLTDEARLVLTHELRRRGISAEPLHHLSQEGSSDLRPNQPVVLTEEPERERGFGPGIPGVFPAGAALVEQALEPERIRNDGMASLIAFYDGLEQSKACAILEEAEIRPSIEAIDGDAMSGVPPRFEIWLGTDRLEAAKALLRARMGLFPLAEVDEDVPAVMPGEFQVIAQFESAGEAREVCAAIVAEGFAAMVEEDGTEGAGWVVTVPAHEHDRALDLVASRLGMG